VRIALIWKNDYPWDIRVEKISRALKDGGHEVHILARNLNRLRVHEEIDGIHVHRLKPLGNRRLNSALSTAAFFNPRWYGALSGLCRRRRIDLLLVRDLPLVFTSLLVGKRLGLPVIFDMAENYPALWKDVGRTRPYSFQSLLMKNPVVAAGLEKVCIRFVDHLLVVIDESKERLIGLGVDEERISIVNNTPDMERIEKLMLGNPGAKARWQGKKVLLYEGYVHESRGLSVAVRAMPLLLKEDPHLVLAVIGDGDDVARLRGLCRELGVERQVEFFGWLPFREIPPLIAASDVCLIPNYATEHKNTTIPNKLFDYMMAGKPVVVSNARPLKRIVEEEQCGWVFESGNPESLAGAVRKVLRDPAAAKEAGENGIRAVRREYHWGRDSRILLNAVDRVLRGRGPESKALAGY
jgi:glycosyltransferase involved in cell wall biosynthesis